MYLDNDQLWIKNLFDETVIRLLSLQQKFKIIIINNKNTNFTAICK